MGAFTNAFDTGNPQGANAANALDAYIRTDTKQALVERNGLEHYPLDTSTINGSTGTNESDSSIAVNGQGRHIPGKVGCLFYGTLAGRDALQQSGQGSIAYTTDDLDGPNFWYLTAGGVWNILAINSETVLADEVTLTYNGNIFEMKHDHQQWTTTSELADAANIETDASLSNSFSVTLAGNRVLDNPTNMEIGATYVWIIEQDATGIRTLGYGTAFKWPGGITPILSTAGDAIDLITGIATSSTSVLCSITYDIK